jgi:hypothetical protein
VKAQVPLGQPALAGPVRRTLREQELRQELREQVRQVGLGLLQVLVLVRQVTALPLRQVPPLERVAQAPRASWVPRQPVHR